MVDAKALDEQGIARINLGDLEVLEFGKE